MPPVPTKYFEGSDTIVVVIEYLSNFLRELGGQNIFLYSRSLPVHVSTTKKSEGKVEKFQEKNEKPRSIVQIQTIWA
jgi:hypothetical protein